ncbi:hypothetical protein JTE90_002995 [Oedothorax gibbosus]|uniref:Uncharacterized protein n=1 Tax=Oedothorax gibbosus TaxID=931172 RepID=A0AAV6VGG8_9ARAC|nr:hypothetical protein JTE90_002995 [Oedothorax gibbosus]
MMRSRSHGIQSSSEITEYCNLDSHFTFSNSIMATPGPRLRILPVENSTLTDESVSPHTTVRRSTLHDALRGPRHGAISVRVPQKSLSIATWTKLSFLTLYGHPGVPDCATTSRKLHTNR